MIRHILLSACGCAALGLFACSRAPESEVVDSAPVVEEEILTAPEATDPAPAQPDTELEEPEEPAITDRPVVDTTDPIDAGEDSPEASAGPAEGGGDVPDIPETVDAHAEPSDMPEEVVAVEPILEQVVNFYRGVESFRVTTELSRQVTDESGEVLDVPTGAPLIGELVLKRPNYLAVTVEEGGAPTVVSDGETVNAYLADYGKFLEDPAPQTFGELSEREIGLALSFAGPFQMVPLILMSDGAQEKLTQGVSEMEYVGHEQLDETAAHHLRFQGEQATPRGIREVTWDMWVAAEGDPFVLQTSLIQGTQTIPLPGEGAATITLSLIEKLHDWEINPELADDMFVATVPETAKAATDIVDLFEAPPPLLGQEAPEVKLPLFGDDAGELDLASLEGTNVVILDFWATWCGPCRMGMPVLAEVAEEYKDRGVLLYAVNIDEGDEEIQTYLEDEGLALTVAKDAGGATANNFGASSIPHSVVIGKDGIVQAVHIGFSPELRTQLSRELDALLDGKDIYDGLPEADDAPAAEEAAGTEEPADTPAEEASATEESESAAPTDSE